MRIVGACVIMMIMFVNRFKVGNIRRPYVYSSSSSVYCLSNEIKNNSNNNIRHMYEKSKIEIYSIYIYIIITEGAFVQKEPRYKSAL